MTTVDEIINANALTVPGNAKSKSALMFAANTTLMQRKRSRGALALDTRTPKAARRQPLLVREICEVGIVMVRRTRAQG